MKKLSIFFAAITLSAQIPDSHVAEAKQMYGSIHNNMVGLVEAMPEEDYSFKPTPDIRSFAELVAHVADAQGSFCSVASGKPKPAGVAGKTAKADLVAALRVSSVLCESAFDSLTAANSGEKVTMGPFTFSRLAMLEFNTGHTNEEYGYMAVYLRLKGVVPPASASRGRGR